MVSAVNMPGLYPAGPPVKGRRFTHNQNHNPEWSDLGMSKAEEAVGATGGACPRESFWQREQQGQRPRGKKKLPGWRK